MNLTISENANIDSIQHKLNVPLDAQLETDNENLQQAEMFK